MVPVSAVALKLPTPVTCLNWFVIRWKLDSILFSCKSCLPPIAIFFRKTNRQLALAIENLIYFRWTIHWHEKHTQQRQNQQFSHSSLSAVPASRCLSRCAFSNSGYENGHGSVPAVGIIRWQSCAICERKLGRGIPAVYFSMSADFLYPPLRRPSPHENWTTSNG